ncbi:hypothetical protein N7509_000721 [Penicillium cosmopolitanum]|uniref:Short chain dehydrogenase n=1 Tax=Penicillium cosmopolitanum TaxID=1131564 RepID=A0A9X0BEH2_9EURO|nr:uncharacterized protein N7509_000721 [Penicillium cosmopolitanum]KAJ5414094.1 hypothetical protein N7509_000721 [Penicillium cosmopolitanum]
MATSKIIVITGANSGIGYATTKFIVSHSGYHVIMGCRDTKKGQAALDEIKSSGDIKGTLSVLQLDVTDDSSIAAAVSQVEKEFGRVDAFLSNAGITAHGYSAREQLNKIFATNVMGAYLTSQSFVPLLLKSEHPCLIQVSSGLGSLGLAANPADPHYNAPWEGYRMSKASLNMATLQQHKQLHCQNVRVFAYCPGLVRSNLRGKSEDAVSAGGAAGDPMTSARGLFDIVEGKRDSEAGQFLNANGTYPW